MTTGSKSIHATGHTAGHPAQPPPEATTTTAGPVPTETPWQAWLGRSLLQEHDYYARIEGVLPTALRGTLYRNGPGLFERNGHRKRSLLDGDGMIQRIEFTDPGVRYRNHFVRTEKFLAEQQAGRFLAPTWTTLAPKYLSNLPGIPPKSQAGVTAVLFNHKLYALDEVGEPYTLDPHSLQEWGEEPVLQRQAAGSYKAHTKIDGRTGQWILLGWTSGPSTRLDVIIKDRRGALQMRRRVKVPRQTYIHDFFVSRRYVIVNLHAVAASPLAMLTGLKSFQETLSWQPAQGNLILVIPRDRSAPVHRFEAPASFMWHSVNAYEMGNTLVADFIGYDQPDHFIGPDPAFTAIMQGRLGQSQYPGILRRYVMDLSRTRLGEEPLADGNFEFPMLHPARTGYAYTTAYATQGRPGTIFHSGIAKIAVDTGRVTSYDFGPHIHVGEPVFVSRGDAEEGGWLLTMALDGQRQRSFIAVLDSEQLADGPVAKVWLQHHTPLSFHGVWQGR